MVQLLAAAAAAVACKHAISLHMDMSRLWSPNLLENPAKPMESGENLRIMGIILSMYAFYIV